jgi:hypothetical protein
MNPGVFAKGGHDVALIDLFFYFVLAQILPDFLPALQHRYAQFSKFLLYSGRQIFCAHQQIRVIAECRLPGRRVTGRNVFWAARRIQSRVAPLD